MCITFRVLCLHGTNFSWVSALCRIGDGNPEAFSGPLSQENLLASVRALDCVSGLELSALLSMVGKDDTNSWSFHHSCVMNLLEWLHVMIIVRKGMFVVLNLHEAVLDTEIMDDLLQLDQLHPGSCASARIGAATGDGGNDGDKVSEETPQAAVRPGPAKGYGGRAPLHVAQLEVVEAVASFVELHGFSAQERRRDDIAHSNGVSQRNSAPPANQVPRSVHQQGLHPSANGGSKQTS